MDMLKRIVALLLCAMMCMPHLALADTDYAALSDEELRAAYQSVLTEMAARAAGDAAPVTAPAEITFRGIPWGTSATEFADLMAKDGVNGSARKGDVYSWERRNLAECVITYAAMPSDRGFAYRVRPSALAVAGVPVSEVEAWFIYDFDAENVYEEPERAQLVHASYEFSDVADRQAMLLLLHEKLCVLYGETPLLHATDPSSSYTEYLDYAVWYGPNDTAVLLYNFYVLKADGTPQTGYTTYLSLHYGKSNSVQLFEALDAAVAREEMEEAMESASFDGL